MNDLHIRRATKNDLESICQIENGSFPEPYPRALMVRLLRDHPTGFFVAETSSGRVVGYCVCSKKGKLAHLISIGVLLEYRRRKVATSLIQELFIQFSSRIRELWLEVNTANEEAVRFYEGFGFRRVMIIENYYSNGSPALRMRLALDQAAKEGAAATRRKWIL
jgi:ribosomal-protein-alanine N-acetyltransferase